MSTADTALNDVTTSTAPVGPTNKTRPKAGGRQPSEQAIDAAIDSATRMLRLPTFRDRYGEIADAAGREQLSYRAFLSELLLAECDDREQRRAARRIHEAGFPRPKTLALSGVDLEQPFVLGTRDVVDASVTCGDGLAAAWLPGLSAGFVRDAVLVEHAP